MENSNIEWTDHTFNPWMGCTKLSQGCANCYAETLMDKRYGKVKWGPQGQRVRTSAANWRKPLAWNKAAGKAGKRARVFCASLADVFEDKADQLEEMDKWRAELFQLIQDTENLDWLILTKRPENVMGMVDAPWYYALPNVWIGTSVENQEQANKRIPELLKIPAAVRFLSMEPLLGAVDLENLAYEAAGPAWAGYNLLIDWVIVGGESGPDARPMHPDWARSIRDQCQEAGVPFFFKQCGEWAWTGDYITDNLYADKQRYMFADRTVMIRAGKRAAGRLLDGREWNEFPNQVTA